MFRMVAAAIGITVGLFPSTAAGSSGWGSPGYGDPPGWCVNHSDMWTTTVVTNDPLVSTNPERDTFYGFHPNPGSDHLYRHFYGSFPGKPANSSSRVLLL